MSPKKLQVERNIWLSNAEGHLSCSTRRTRFFHTGRWHTCKNFQAARDFAKRHGYNGISITLT